ncbi:3-keto-5-aminohexanoate cleavage protein [Thalassococcus sp. S3]|uniref:3-keto-5-aminohexanoate cleavage protein n=1 Tax=Thalassococcus sp. S3 TaxID=2017482 RepID=UPI0010244E7E|nr:3-keto-5-aminohexanoate cleavage protein [Thalassococcus sp. S3]QBF32610.1 3-keto-5-aminohexanoate cleavage protein [Thalassococcus sp. S3]
MTTPCIICVAITGSVPTKSDNPAVPISVSEQIESTHEAFEAGASICHAHVRNDDETPSSDPEKFAALKEGVERHCPGMIIQFSTGGRSGAGRARGGMLPLCPDMASLSVGSNNFPTRVYENPPDLVDWLAGEMLTYDIKPEIEAFDLSHIFRASQMFSAGRIKEVPYVQFVMGVKNAMPADKQVFDFYVATVQRLFPGAPWCAAGIGANQIPLNEWAIAAGGHARTGLEDNVRLDKATLAPSNAALVRRTVEICATYDRPVAQPHEARAILGLRAAVA